MTISLTNLKIGGVAGEAAYLPNQPILGAVLSNNVEGTVPTGAIVTLMTGGQSDAIIVKQAAATEKPFGVIVYNAIKTGFVKNDRISVFPDGSYVKLPVADADVQRGDVLYFNANGQVTGTDPEEAGTYGIIGEAITEPNAIGDLIVVKVATATKTIAG